jgi:hypothetical protein
MSAQSSEGDSLGSFLGGFSYHLRFATPQTRMVRLDVFRDRVVVRPRSGRRGFFTPTWEARYTDLRPVRVVRRPLFRGIRFRRSDGDMFTFRPAGEFLADGVEPVLAALRAAGVVME